MQNGRVESFNGECLNMHWFTTLRQARNIVENWRTDYNEVRPHSALWYATPKEFASQSSASFAVQTLPDTMANRFKASLTGSLRSALTRPRHRGKCH